MEGRDQEGRPFWALSYPVERYDRFHYPQPKSNGWGDNSSSTYLGKRVTVTSQPGAPLLYADLTITFPRQGALAVRNVVGPVHGGELAGGGLTIDTGSGDVQLAAFTGGLSIDTGSGDVKVGLAGGIEGDRLSVDTGSGDVTVRSPLTRTASVRVDTGSGDVSIWAAADASFRVHADQGSGELDVRYADARLIRDGREVVGAERGDGRTRIDVDTGSGDCIVAPAR